jgi:hypothetical protein
MKHINTKCVQGVQFLNGNANGISILTTVCERLSCKGKRERIVNFSCDWSYSNNAVTYNFVKNKLIVREGNWLQLEAMFFFKRNDVTKCHFIYAKKKKNKKKVGISEHSSLEWRSICFLNIPE